VIPKPRRSIDSLAVLNRKSCELAFGLEDIDWSFEADRTKPWAPEGFGPICYLPGFALLDEAERLRCNQFQALSLCEQFIWLERHVIQPLTRVLERSEPDWYRSRIPRLFRVSPLQQFGIERVVENPRLLVAWIWLTIFVEERTLYLARRYIETEKETPGRIDRLHTQLHQFHFRDEARHYQLDQHVLTWLYDPQPRWKKKLSAWIFHYMMRCYANPRHSARAVLAQLAREFPRLRKDIVPRLHAELAQVGRNEEFHRKHFSRSALPRTLALLAEYPEHDRLWTLFITESKHPA